MIDRHLAPSAAALVERVPPHSQEAEMALLGSILLDGEAMGFVAEALRPEDFYRAQHGRLFEIMQGLYDRGEPVDVLLVRRECEQAGILGEIGDEFLSELATVVTSPAHAEHYAQIVREKAVARSLISAASQIQQAAFGDECRGDELLELAEARVFELGNRRDANSARDVKSLLQETFAEITRGEGPSEGVRTGFTHFDGLTGGFRPGELIIVAARPSMGKSSFALNLATHAAVHEKVPVAVFSLEMTAQNIMKNILCAEARVPGKLLRERGRVLGQDVLRRLGDAAGYLTDAPLYVDDSPALSPTGLRAKARRIKAKHGLGMVIVDYLQLMDARNVMRGSDNRQQEISYISRSLKGLARELQVPVIALSQLNRDAEKRDGNKPKLSDLRESGALEQDADVICLLFRPAYYLKMRGKEHLTDEERVEAQVIIAKQRNGPTGVVQLHFHEDFVRFDAPTMKRM
jgi:replicative DNA helicase